MTGNSQTALRPFQAISIDLDNTLWPVMPAIERAERAVHRWLDQHCPEVSRRWSIEDLRELRDQVAAQSPELAHDYAWMRRQTLDRVLGEYGYGEAHCEQAYALFFEHRNRVDLYPEVGQVLARWSRQFPMLALTNGNADLVQTGVGSWLSARLSPADVGCAKPHPDMFHSAARQLGFEPAQVLHIGDNPREDIQGAREAGLQALWLNRRGDAWQGEGQAPAEAACLASADQLMREALAAS